MAFNFGKGGALPNKPAKKSEPVTEPSKEKEKKSSFPPPKPKGSPFPKTPQDDPGSTDPGSTDPDLGGGLPGQLQPAGPEPAGGNGGLDIEGIADRYGYPVEDVRSIAQDVLQGVLSQLGGGASQEAVPAPPQPPSPMMGGGMGPGAGGMGGGKV